MELEKDLENESKALKIQTEKVSFLRKESAWKDKELQKKEREVHTLLEKMELLKSKVEDLEKYHEEKDHVMKEIKKLRDDLLEENEVVYKRNAIYVKILNSQKNYINTLITDSFNNGKMTLAQAKALESQIKEDKISIENEALKVDIERRKETIEQLEKERDKLQEQYEDLLEDYKDVLGKKIVYFDAIMKNLLKAEEEKQVEHFKKEIQFLQNNLAMRIRVEEV